MAGKCRGTERIFLDRKCLIFVKQTNKILKSPKTPKKPQNFGWPKTEKNILVEKAEEHFLFHSNTSKIFKNKMHVRQNWF